jgi:hypothetical protein
LWDSPTHGFYHGGDTGSFLVIGSVFVLRTAIPQFGQGHIFVPDEIRYLVKVEVRIAENCVQNLRSVFGEVPAE